jgi:hypothetical protein
MANVFSLLHPAFFKITSNGTEFTLALAAERTLYLKKLSTEYVFKYDGILKQSRPSQREFFVHFIAYPPDRRLCI